MASEVPQLVEKPPRVPLTLLSSVSTAGKVCTYERHKFVYMNWLQADLLSYILHGSHGKKIVVIESPMDGKAS